MQHLHAQSNCDADAGRYIICLCQSYGGPNSWNVSQHVIVIKKNGDLQFDYKLEATISFMLAAWVPWAARLSVII